MKDFLTIKDVQNILSIGRNKAYDLVKTQGFPKIVIGKTIRVPKDEFEVWVKKYSYRSFKT